MASDAVCLFLTWVTYTPSDTQEVKPNHGLLVIQLLENAREQVGPSERGSNVGTQSEKLLQRLEKVVIKRTGFRGVEALNYCLGEIVLEQEFLDLGCFLLEPEANV